MGAQRRQFVALLRHGDVQVRPVDLGKVDVLERLGELHGVVLVEFVQLAHAQVERSDGEDGIEKVRVVKRRLGRVPDVNVLQVRRLRRRETLADRGLEAVDEVQLDLGAEVVWDHTR